MLLGEPIGEEERQDNRRVKPDQVPWRMAGPCREHLECKPCLTEFSDPEAKELFFFFLKLPSISVIG